VELAKTVTLPSLGGSCKGLTSKIRQFWQRRLAKFV